MEDLLALYVCTAHKPPPPLPSHLLAKKLKTITGQSGVEGRGVPGDPHSRPVLLQGRDAGQVSTGERLFHASSRQLPCDTMLLGISMPSPGTKDTPGRPFQSAYRGWSIPAKKCGHFEGTLSLVSEGTPEQQHALFTSFVEAGDPLSENSLTPGFRVLDRPCIHVKLGRRAGPDPGLGRCGLQLQRAGQAHPAQVPDPPELHLWSLHSGPVGPPGALHQVCRFVVLTEAAQHLACRPLTNLPTWLLHCVGRAIQGGVMVTIGNEAPLLCMRTWSKPGLGPNPKPYEDLVQTRTTLRRRIGFCSTT